MRASVGELLADELAARGWTQTVFAEVLGRPLQFVNEVLNGKKELTRESAMQVAAALGTSPEIWLRVQDEFHLWRLSSDPTFRARIGAIHARSARQSLKQAAQEATRTDG